MNDHPECVVLLADIHANEAALLAVIRHARTRYATHESLRFWFLGDIFGRGPDAAGAWQRLLDLECEAAVAGNHDWGLCGRSANILVDGQWQGEFNRVDWQILLDQRKELGWLGLLSITESQQGIGLVADYLAQLPVVSVPRPGVFMVHGGMEAPFDPNHASETIEHRLVWEYVNSPEQVRYTLEALVALSQSVTQLPSTWGQVSTEPTIVLLGHTHRRFLFSSVSHVGGWVQPAPLDQEYRWRADPNYPVVISPGSVGFPRERQYRAACYAVLCYHGDDIWSVMFHEVPFARGQVQNAMRGLGRPEETVHLLDLPGKHSHAAAVQASA